MKILDLNQMELLEAGMPPGQCEEMANALGGAGLLFGVASWWTGAGAGIALAIGGGAYVLGLYCQSQAQQQ